MILLMFRLESLRCRRACADTQTNETLPSMDVEFVRQQTSLRLVASHVSEV